MRENTNSPWLPPIIISDIDQARLSGVATAAMDRVPEIAEELMSEIERATVVEARSIPSNVVRMGSTVEFETNDGQHRRVTLVFPGEADISRGKISVLTPVGAALIGLSEGHSIMWMTRDGRHQQLTVLAVEPMAPSCFNAEKRQGQRRL
jgi:regulator of nucleoside diphosphate kinase